VIVNSHLWTTSTLTCKWYSFNAVGSVDCVIEKRLWLND
jgi:hypothetical protein